MNNDDYDAIDSCPEPSQPLSPRAYEFVTPKKRGGNLLVWLFTGCLSSSQ